MKQYPSIPPAIHHIGQPCIAFYKYDGSNLRFEYSKKAGWYKFGTRERLFDKTDPVFGSAIDLFTNTYGQDIENIIKNDKQLRNVSSIICFAEFFGSRSFAGQHHNNDPKELVLFDVNIHKKGILGPSEFINYFGHLKIAKIIYQGNLTQGFINSVRNNEISDLNEGVIAKGGSGHNLWMCKIKTLAYKEKLKQVYTDKWQQYWE